MGHLFGMLTAFAIVVSVVGVGSSVYDHSTANGEVNSVINRTFELSPGNTLINRVSSDLNEVVYEGQQGNSLVFENIHVVHDSLFASHTTEFSLMLPAKVGSSAVVSPRHGISVKVEKLYADGSVKVKVG